MISKIKLYRYGIQIAAVWLWDLQLATYWAQNGAKLDCGQIKLDGMSGVIHGRAQQGRQEESRKRAGCGDRLRSKWWVWVVDSVQCIEDRILFSPSIVWLLPAPFFSLSGHCAPHALQLPSVAESLSSLVILLSLSDYASMVNGWKHASQNKCF